MANIKCNGTIEATSISAGEAVYVNGASAITSSGGTINGTLTITGTLVI